MYVRKKNVEWKRKNDENNYVNVKHKNQTKSREIKLIYVVYDFSINTYKYSRMKIKWRKSTEENKNKKLQNKRRKKHDDKKHWTTRSIVKSIYKIKVKYGIKDSRVIAVTATPPPPPSPPSPSSPPSPPSTTTKEKMENKKKNFEINYHELVVLNWRWISWQ